MALVYLYMIIERDILYFRFENKQFIIVHNIYYNKTQIVTKYGTHIYKRSSEKDMLRFI